MEADNDKTPDFPVFNGSMGKYGKQGGGPALRLPHLKQGGDGKEGLASLKSAGDFARLDPGARPGMTSGRQPL